MSGLTTCSSIRRFPYAAAHIPSITTSLNSLPCVSSRPQRPRARPAPSVRDGCVAANSARCRDSPRGEQDCFTAPETSNTAVMLSDHCSKCRQRARRDRSDDPVPADRTISRPSDVIASTDRRSGRQLRQVLTAREQYRHEHDVAQRPHATCDRRRASPRSAHTAFPRTLRKSKSESVRRSFGCLKVFT